MNNDIADIISQMDDRTFYQFLQTDFKDLTGREFLGQQIKNQDTQQLKERAIKAIQFAEQPDETKSRVIGAYLTPEMKLSSAEVQQPQEGRSANVAGYSFDDDNYNAIAGEYDDVGYDLLDDSAYAPSGRNQGGAAKPSGASQAPLDIAGVKNAIEQDPNWQPRNDYEKWVVGQLQGAEWTPNPTVTSVNVNRTAGVSTPKAQDEKYQFNVLEDRENRTANIQNIPIPKPVGIRTDLQTGLVYDYNRGLVFNPATGVTQKLISGGRTIPTKLEVPNLIQGEQSNFIPFINTGDRELDRAQQQELVDNQLTSGENRFFGTAQFSRKRDYSVPDEYKRFIGTSPRIAQVNQAYSPEVMSRVGQNSYLNNAGSILLPQTWIDKETGNTVFSRGRGTATTIVYKGDKEGNAIPSISIPRVEGSGNELVSFEDAVERQLITPEQYNNYINQAAQTRFIPASGMDSFNRENVKLYEATDNSGNNYRATYMNPQTKEVFNVTRNGGFYLVRPGVSEEASGLPAYKNTTNLAQEMTDINRGMREGGRDNLVDIIREDPDNPGLEAFTRPVPAINPVTGETINKYVSTGNSGRWVDDNNPQDLFNYFNANAESSGQSMEALDLARGGRRTAGIRKAPTYITNPNYVEGEKYPITYTDSDGNIRQIEVEGSPVLSRRGLVGRQETTIFNSGNPITVFAPTGYQNPNATPAYPSLQETDYLGGRLGFNAEGNIVDVPSQELAAKGINNFTPASEFYTNTSQLVRDTRTGKVIYDPNRTVYVRAAQDWYDDGDFAIVPYKEDKPVVSRVANINSPQSIVINDGKVVGKNAVVQQEIFGNQEVYPGDFTNTQFYRFKTNPESPLRAFNVNEYGIPIPDSYGFPQEVLTSKGEPIDIPRSAQIANKAEFISQPRLMVQDFKGVTPDYQPIPDGMSYEEADRRGLLNPIFNARTVGLNSSYQIPLPKGVGLARVLDEADPRTQAAITAQAKAEARIASDTTIVKPAFDRKYTITPGRIAGIESPQYAQYMDLTPNVNDTNAGWKENISGVVPKGVIEGAYLPVTVTPRPVNAEGKKGWLYPNQIYTTESGREVRGDKALNYVNVPLNLDSVATSSLPKSKREELELKGFTSDDIDAWVKTNPNLARDNALANAKILIDGQYYDVTPQATVPEFNPAAGGNYLQAVNRTEHRGARIDLPFKAGTNISEPTPEWIAQQAAKGNLAFNPDDYISPEDKVILNQKEIYNAGYEEPTDILGAINRVQQKKNRIDAVISNREQRAMNNLNEQVGSVVDGNYTTLSPGMKVFNQDILSNPEDLSTPISENFVGPVQLIRDAQSPTRKTFKGWQNYSDYLGDEIARASAAHNAIIGIEDAPEITVKRTGTYNAVEDFNERVADELGLKVLDSRNPSYIVGYDNQERPLFESKAYGSLPNNLLPYQQVKALNKTELLPAYRTQQKVELPTVPTSNVMNLGRVTPFPEEVITTQQFIPAGNQVVDIANDNVAIVPSSSEKYQYRSGGNTNYDPWDIVDNSELGMMGGMGFDGGSIPGDDIPRQVRTNVQQRVQVEPNVRTSRTQSPNTPIEPDVRMTGGMKIPKWAIPATLGAVWLGLAANARRQQDEERRQQQSVGIR